MNIGSKIKDARNEAGYTQERAAEALGVSRQTISNWENERPYPDIVSVIRMSDCYHVSLDLLLKEKTTMNDTYLEYLEESTNRVKSNDTLTKAILIGVALVVYAMAQYLFWTVTGSPATTTCTFVFKYLLLPLSALLISAFAGRADWWGRGKWTLVAVFSVLFLLVPAVTFASDGAYAYEAFLFPNITYLFVGAAASLIGLFAGEKMRNSRR